MKTENVNVKANDFSKAVSRAYSLRGQAIKRAKDMGQLRGENSKATHSKALGLVKLSEQYSVPSTFSFTKDERDAMRLIAALETVTRLTGVPILSLLSGDKVEPKGAKNEPTVETVTQTEPSTISLVPSPVEVTNEPESEPQGDDEGAGSAGGDAYDADGKPIRMDGESKQEFRARRQAWYEATQKAA